MPIGPTIKQWRMAHRLTQPEMARLVGVSAPVISTWETERAAPNHRYQSLLIDVLELDPERLAARITEVKADAVHKPSKMKELGDSTRARLKASIGDARDNISEFARKLGFVTAKHFVDKC